VYDVSLIVPTRDRPFLLKRCVEYMSRQAFPGKIEMIIVSDSKESDHPGNSPSKSLDIYHAWRGTGDINPIISQANNVLYGLRLVTTDKILFIEDDDWYSPDYVSDRVQFLEKYEAVGKLHTIYYHLGRGWIECGNGGHGSLFETAMRGPRAIDTMALACNESVRKGAGYIDMRFWKAFRQLKIKNIMKSEKKKHMAIGMKFPKSIGVPTIGVRHWREADTMRGAVEDPGQARLEAAIGKEDADYYRNLLKEGEDV
jgi:glycosyltransferase involved in cell wall biosynthesis